MQQMAFNINQNVLIVSVLDLKDVANKRVSGQRVGEIVYSSLVFL